MSPTRTKPATFQSTVQSLKPAALKAKGDVQESPAPPKKTAPSWKPTGGAKQPQKTLLPPFEVPRPGVPETGSPAPVVNPKTPGLGTAGAVKIAAPTAALWKSDTVAKIGLKAPLTELFSHRNDPEGSKPKVTGEATLDSRAGPVKVAVQVKLRGNTSKTDLDFPKIKLKADGSVAGTTLDGVKSVSIGTHGGESAELTPLGRLANENSPHRESAVYNALEELGIPVMQSRAGRIAYEDSSTGKTVERNAFFLEDIDDVAKRLGGTEVDVTDGWKGSIRDSLGYSQALRVSLAQTMTGVQDWSIEDGKATTGQQLWNVKIIEQPGGKQVVVPYDYDTATMVTGGAVKDLEFLSKERFLPQKSERVRQISSDIITMRTNWLSIEPKSDKPVARKALLDVAQDMKTRQKAVIARLKTVPMDEAGRKNALEHANAFFEALDTAVSMPILSSDSPQFFSDAKKKTPVDMFIEVGAPLQILARDDKNKMVQVRVLSETNGPTEAWIDASSIDP
jgi:hypothetical protein